MKIVLKSNILEVTKVKKKNKSLMWGNLKVGDKIRLFISVEAAGQNKGTYASYINATNIKTGEATRESFNQIVRPLNYFIFKDSPNHE